MINAYILLYLTKKGFKVYEALAAILEAENPELFDKVVMFLDSCSDYDINEETESQVFIWYDDVFNDNNEASLWLLNVMDKIDLEDIRYIKYLINEDIVPFSYGTNKLDDFVICTSFSINKHI